MNPIKQHKKLISLQEKAEMTSSRETAQKILKKYKKAQAKLDKAGQP